MRVKIGLLFGGIDERDFDYETAREKKIACGEPWGQIGQTARGVFTRPPALSPPPSRFSLPLPLILSSFASLNKLQE